MGEYDQDREKKEDNNSSGISSLESTEHSAELSKLSEIDTGNHEQELTTDIESHSATLNSKNELQFAGEGDDDPVEDALYTALMQATATGASPEQAFNVGIHAAKEVAISAGIPEEVFDEISANLYPPYLAAIEEALSPQEALKEALAVLGE